MKIVDDTVSITALSNLGDLLHHFSQLGSSVENVCVNSFALCHRDIPDEADACTTKFCEDFLTDGFDALVVHFIIRHWNRKFSTNLLYKIRNPHYLNYLNNIELAHM
jgi:hypothetical protein